jgi:hypothetical protein
MLLSIGSCSCNNFVEVPFCLSSMRVSFLIFFLLLSILSGPSMAQLSTDKLDFPVPTQIPDMLFYLQRSLDINTVIYEANYKAPVAFGELDPKEPVKIYWKRYTDGGSIAPLLPVQRLGYGIKAEKVANQVTKITLVAYRKIPIYLKPVPNDSRYRAHVTIKGKEVILSRVYINIDGGTKLKPNVKYIELAGTYADGGGKVTERLYP